MFVHEFTAANKKVTKYDLFQRVFFKNDNNAFRTFPTT